MTKPQTPTARIGRGLVGYRKGHFFLNLLGWGTMWVLPVIPALITREFFDRITGDDPTGFTVTTLVMIMIAYGLGRISLMVVAMWNDIHLTFRISSLLRRNMLEEIFDLPGAQSMKESPGEAISRFRDDVDEIQETFTWTLDMLGLSAFIG